MTNRRTFLRALAGVPLMARGAAEHLKGEAGFGAAGINQLGVPTERSVGVYTDSKSSRIVQAFYRARGEAFDRYDDRATRPVPMHLRGYRSWSPAFARHVDAQERRAMRERWHMPDFWDPNQPDADHIRKQAEWVAKRGKGFLARILGAAE